MNWTDYCELSEKVGMKEIIYKEESYKIIGSCLKVHKALGCGF